MNSALEQFFPDETANVPLPKSSSDHQGDIPLRRVNSGATSIVGLDNGERPGGFILVVDGAALLEVGWHSFLKDFR